MIQKIKSIWNKILKWGANHTSLIITADVIGIVVIVLFCVLGQFQVVNQTLSKFIIYSTMVAVVLISIPAIFADYSKKE